MDQTQLTHIMDTLELIYPTNRKETRFKEIPAYKEGLYKIQKGVYAWMVPNGSWGESNAGLILGESSSLLVDTLWDLDCTREMLHAFMPLTDKSPIKQLVNTHADGDHFWGNQLLPDTEIISSRKCYEEIFNVKPKSLLLFEKLGLLLSKIKLFNLDKVGHWFKGMVAPYDFKNIIHTPPNKTFEGELSLDVSGKKVTLIDVGPAHTKGDIFVHIPDAKVLFASDILFIGSTPVMWAGPTQNCLDALDTILELDVEKIIPGHGPVTDKTGVNMVKEYWNFVFEEVNSCFKNGWSAEKAATQIALSQSFSNQMFSTWNSPERLMANAHTIYRELSGRKDHPKVPELIRIMRKQALLAHKLPNAQPAVMRVCG